MPNTASENSLTECLQNTLKEYNEVKKSYPENVDGIVTSNRISQFLLNANNFSLENCVASMTDKDLRTLAYRIFSKHPIEKYYAEIDENDLLKKDYTITVAGTNHTAINPVIVSSNNGVLFTLGFHNDLRKDVLRITSNTTATVDVNNLFGLAVNTTYIKDLIKQSITDKFGNYEKLLEMIGANSCSTRFKKSFDDLSSQVQLSILEHFEAAKKRKGVTPFFADKDLIKDVTPERIPFKVYELRIFSPVAFRVYFYEAQAKTYLAMAEKKPADKKQDTHIDAATSIIKQLLYFDE